MNPDLEIRRLLDVMPASGRMLTKIVSKPDQAKVIDSPFPVPWVRTRSILINFDLWSQLNRGQRDLLLLYQVSWLTSIRWFKPDLSQGLALAGLIGAGAEFFQGDTVGVLVAGALTAFAGMQIWRGSQSSRLDLEADEAALQVAQRRGYAESEAAKNLLSAIEAVARIEGRPSLNFMELVRCQNLKAIAGLSTVGVPQSLRQE